MGDDFPGEDAYWVRFYAVDPKYQKQGIGKRLLKTIENVVVQKGQKQLWVCYVPKTNTYYERQGFKIVKTGKISGNTKYFMVKKL